MSVVFQISVISKVRVQIRRINRLQIYPGVTHKMRHASVFPHLLYQLTLGWHRVSESLNVISVWTRRRGLHERWLRVFISLFKKIRNVYHGVTVPTGITGSQLWQLQLFQLFYIVGFRKKNDECLVHITFLILHSEIKFKFLIKILVLLVINNNKTKIDYWKSSCSLNKD